MPNGAVNCCRTTQDLRQIISVKPGLVMILDTGSTPQQQRARVNQGRNGTEALQSDLSLKLGIRFPAMHVPSLSFRVRRLMIKAAPIASMISCYL